MTTGKKKWTWSEEAKQAQSERMKQIHMRKRRGQGQSEAWRDADDRKDRARRDMKEAWAMRKARVLFRVGKFQIIWG